MIRILAPIGFVIFLIVLFGYSAYEALTFQRLASYFPLSVSLIGGTLTLYVLFKEASNLRGRLRNPENLSSIGSYALYISWMIGFVAGIYFVGLPIAAAIFLFFFLKYEANQSYLFISISVLAVLGVLIGFAELMNLNYPRSLITIIDI